MNCWAIRYATHDSLSLECDARPSAHSVAQPISSLEDRDLLWREDDPDRISGVLGISVAGAEALVAIPEVDSRDGRSSPPKAKENLSGQDAAAIPSRLRNLQARFDA
jgi:hypothetical protein